MHAKVWQNKHADALSSDGRLRWSSLRCKTVVSIHPNIKTQQQQIGIKTRFWKQEINLLQTLITFYTHFCRRHPVSDNARIHCSCLHIPLTSLTVILLHAWCTKTVISTSHSISSVLFIYMTVLACIMSCHLINENDDEWWLGIDNVVPVNWVNSNVSVQTTEMPHTPFRVQHE